MGIETHCFAWDREDSICKELADYFYPISILEMEKILDECKKIQIDGICSIASDICVPTVWFIAEKMNLTGNKYENPFVASHKFLMRKALLKNGVNSPRFTIMKNVMDLKEFKYPLIVKPTDQVASIGVIKVEREEDLQDAIQKSQEVSYNKEVIVEEFITGVEVSVDSISCNGEHYILAIKDKECLKNNEIIFLAEHYPCQLNSKIQEKIKAETIKTLDAINIKNGAACTQFKITETGEVFSIEINPRMAGDFVYEVLKLHNGYDIVKGVIEVALGMFEKPVFTKNKYAGTYFLYDESDWIRNIIENKDKDLDIKEGAIINKGVHGRKGYFIYQSNNKRRWGK